LTIPARITRFSAAIRNRKLAETIVPKTPPNCSSARVGFGDRAEHRLLRDHDPGADRDDDRGVAEGEEEADAQRPLALVHQLAGGVVDGGDVVGVEGVPHAEGVGEHRDADAEALVVLGDDQEDEDCRSRRRAAA
jgi:hypothetical protein